MKGREDVDQDIKTPQNIWGRSCALENSTGVQRRQFPERTPDLSEN